MLTVSFMLGGGPLGEGGILRPIYQKYYEEVLGLDNPAVSATAIPVNNTSFHFLWYYQPDPNVLGWMKI